VTLSPPRGDDLLLVGARLCRVNWVLGLPCFGVVHVVSGGHLQGIPAAFRMLWGPFGGLRVFAFVWS
jgi:hypothetical protein